MRLLDERYPTQTFVMSDQPFRASNSAGESPTRVSSELIAEVIASYQNLNSAPEIVVPTFDQVRFHQIQTEVKAILASRGLDPAAVDRRVNASVRRADAPAYTWQQDYFEATFNRESGSPQLSPITGYGRGMEVAISPLAAALAQTGVSQGINIDRAANNQMSDTALSGGNIEAAPGGFCMVGNNQQPEYYRQFCGDDPANVIQLDTSWLAVGHVDEIVKVAPAQYNDGRPAECNFTVMLASPDKALQLMRAPGASAAPLFVNQLSGQDAQDYYAQFNPGRIRGNPGDLEHMLCQAAEKLPSQGGSPLSPDGGNGDARQSFWRRILEMSLISRAHAEDLVAAEEANRSVSELGPGEYKNGQCKTADFARVSNGNFLEQYEADEDMQETNRLIQEAMNRNAALLRQKILSRLPQCTPFYASMEWQVPDLFAVPKGSLVKSLDEKGNEVTTLQRNSLEEPGSYGTALSIFPNPTNGVVANNTMIFSKPHAGVFEADLRAESKRRGIRYAEIDSYEYSHLGQGNLHCSSHSFLSCTTSLQCSSAPARTP